MDPKGSLGFPRESPGAPKGTQGIPRSLDGNLKGTQGIPSQGAPKGIQGILGSPLTPVQTPAALAALAAALAV